MVQPRRQWEHRRKAGDVPAPPGEHLTTCKSCTIRVGQTYVHNELYLLPSLDKRGRMQWRDGCATCAVEHHGLPFGFCLLSELDWAGQNLLHFEAARTWKQQLLEAELKAGWELLLAKQSALMGPYARNELFVQYCSESTPAVATLGDYVPPSTEDSGVLHAAA
jgi:hypothetical protein